MTRTRLVDVAAMRRLLHEVGLDAFTLRLVERLEADFRRWDEFEKSPRAAAHSEVGVIEVMPTADRERYAFKYVNGHPGNPALGLPTVMAIGLLAEVRTGFPILLAEMTLLTAIRTAATSAMATKWLARPESRTMAMIGCGAQAEFQIRAHAAATELDRFRLYDLDPAAMAKVVRNLPDHRIDVCASVSEAIAGADVITTSTADKNRAKILRAGDVVPGVHLNAIGGDCPGKTELDPDLLTGAFVAVEYEPQTRIEGELQARPDVTPVELHRVIRGEVKVDRSGMTVFDSVGFAIEDFTALNLVHEEASARGIGAGLDLIVELADVKDLYRALG